MFCHQASQSIMKLESKKSVSWNIFLPPPAAFELKHLVKETEEQTIWRGCNGKGFDWTHEIQKAGHYPAHYVVLSTRPNQVQNKTILQWNQKCKHSNVMRRTSWIRFLLNKCICIARQGQRNFWHTQEPSVLRFSNRKYFSAPYQSV